jgi:hypothetical protein
LKTDFTAISVDHKSRDPSSRPIREQKRLSEEGVGDRIGKKKKKKEREKKSNTKCSHTKKNP